MKTTPLSDHVRRARSNMRGPAPTVRRAIADAYEPARPLNQPTEKRPAPPKGGASIKVDVTDRRPIRPHRTTRSIA